MTPRPKKPSWDATVARLRRKYPGFQPSHGYDPASAAQYQAFRATQDARELQKRNLRTAE